MQSEETKKHTRKIEDLSKLKDNRSKARSLYLRELRSSYDRNQLENQEERSHPNFREREIREELKHQDVPDGAPTSSQANENVSDSGKSKQTEHTRAPNHYTFVQQNAREETKLNRSPGSPIFNESLMRTPSNTASDIHKIKVENSSQFKLVQNKANVSNLKTPQRTDEDNSPQVIDEQEEESEDDSQSDYTSEGELNNSQAMDSVIQSVIKLNNNEHSNNHCSNESWIEQVPEEEEKNDTQEYSSVSEQLVKDCSDQDSKCINQKEAMVVLPCCHKYTIETLKKKFQENIKIMNDYKCDIKFCQRYFEPSMILGYLKSSPKLKIYQFEQECEKSFNAGNGILLICDHCTSIGFWRRSDPKTCSKCNRTMIDVVNEQNKTKKKIRDYIAKTNGKDISFIEQESKKYQALYDLYFDSVTKNFTLCVKCGFMRSKIINLETPDCECEFQ
ncbi:unnamed protein product [Moneuplotes crassus]|uniref:Uncharacterized protein n=1 Tax=Euplotes crassus TaxID=5936 RepID=A0AAD1UP62_EUPCR|nr:unnamed protein product [Moneuplotes crassus]